jgi:hypothetical protein
VIVTGFMIVVAAFLTAYLLFQMIALVRWQRGWRLAALIPFAGVTYVAVRLVLAMRADPSAGNLWPLEALIWSAFGLAFLSAVHIARGVIQLGREG